MIVCIYFVSWISVSLSCSGLLKLKSQSEWCLQPPDFNTDSMYSLLMCTDTEHTAMIWTINTHWHLRRLSVIQVTVVLSALVEDNSESGCLLHHKLFVFQFLLNEWGSLTPSTLSLDILSVNSGRHWFLACYRLGKNLILDWDGAICSRSRGTHGARWSFEPETLHFDPHRISCCIVVEKCFEISISRPNTQQHTAAQQNRTISLCFGLQPWPMLRLILSNMWDGYGRPFLSTFRLMINAIVR